MEWGEVGTQKQCFTPLTFFTNKNILALMLPDC